RFCEFDWIPNDRPQNEVLRISDRGIFAWRWRRAWPTERHRFVLRNSLQLPPPFQRCLQQPPDAPATRDDLAALPTRKTHPCRYVLFSYSMRLDPSAFYNREKI